MENAFRAYSQNKSANILSTFIDPKGPSGNIPEEPEWSPAFVRNWVICFDSVPPCLIILVYRSILYGNYADGLLDPPTGVLINRQVLSFNSEATSVRQIPTPVTVPSILQTQHPDAFPDIVAGNTTDLWTPPTPLAFDYSTICSTILTDVFSYNILDLLSSSMGE